MVDQATWFSAAKGRFVVVEAKEILKSSPCLVSNPFCAPKSSELLGIYERIPIIFDDTGRNVGPQFGSSWNLFKIAHPYPKYKSYNIF